MSQPLHLNERQQEKIGLLKVLGFWALIFQKHSGLHISKNNLGDPKWNTKVLPVLALLPPPGSLVNQVRPVWHSCYKCPSAVVRAPALELAGQHTKSKTRRCKAQVHLELEPHLVCSALSPQGHNLGLSLPILPEEGETTLQLPMCVLSHFLG